MTAKSKLPASRFAKMNDVVSDVTGLELWLTGEVDFDIDDLENMFCRVQARMLVVQAILWPSPDDSPDDSLDGADSDVPSTGPRAHTSQE